MRRSLRRAMTKVVALVFSFITVSINYCSSTYYAPVSEVDPSSRSPPIGDHDGERPDAIRSRRSATLERSGSSFARGANPTALAVVEDPEKEMLMLPNALSKFLRHMSSVAVLMLSGTTYASTCTALANGDWGAATTWDCDHAPQPGDMIIIPSGRTVTVFSNYLYSGAAMRVRIFGTLFFNGGGSKLSFPCGSIVEIMDSNATVAGNNSGSSESVKICGIKHWQVSDGPQTGYQAWPPNATLPVELLTFTGTGMNGDVQLEWATATESNCDHFELRRSRDGAVYGAVVAVAAAGNSIHTLHYSHADRPPSLGVWYYRLLQYDMDGTANDLGTIVVELEAKPGFQCGPVPATDHLDIISSELPTTLVMFDPDGRTVREQVLTAERNTLDVSNLPNGPYVVHASTTSRVDAQRIVIAH